MLTGSLQFSSVFDKTFDTTAGSLVRRNGLVRLSKPIVVGRVGLPSAKRFLSFFKRDSMSLLSGSTAAAKSKLDMVYSCPQKTLVWSGRDESFSSEKCICSAVPSKSLPHPPAKSVSPEKSIGDWLS